ncbi:peptide/nickel transport system substrate-binding protein [Caldalkalibacillus uzonensis]|uniref:Peptide/nickel transport system substrate-binding protein n=1 Tax=Caldalkalibacillus uzonensis TaxID=353224 RepID=A0ABU0CQ43_9BACI|nr:ABC transporter substrate-binding protein [Caldalkalibacillus uzonensis]MDQ0338533.1 peptide/nickel transport system substrate-binding protein [Caldalkalibacillus uzonensis]
MRGTFKLCFLLAVTLMLISACGQAAPTESPSEGEQEASESAGQSADKTTLVVGLDDDPPQLDPHFSTAAVDRQVYQNLYDKLVDIDEQLNFVPQLAEDWEISDDGTVYTFYLRQGVTFHDGTPFNAEAVKFNIERMMDPNNGSPRAAELQSIDTIEVIDEHTLEVHLKEPFSPFLAVLSDRAGMMVSPTAIEEKGEDFRNSPVGTGPFKFVERVRQDRLVLERNEDYWGEQPQLEKIIYRPYSDENVRLTNLLSGELDIINKVPPKDVERLRNESGIVLSESGALGFQGLYLNNKDFPFNVKELRNALDLVIDREAIVNVALRDAAIPSAGAIPPGSWAYDESIQVKERDVEAAKRLMAEAGYPDGFSFTLKINPRPVEEQIGQMIQSMAAEAGIDVELEIVEFGTLIDQLDNFEFEAARLGWSGRVDPDGNMHPLLHSNGSINYGYSNPEMDELLDRARAETDPEVRKELYRQAAELAQEESPYIFIYHELDFTAYKDNLKGFRHLPDTMMRFHDVYFE